MNSLLITHPNIVNIWHPTKNGELTPDKVTAGSNYKVWWLCKNTCPEGCLHEWKAVIHAITNGNGCPFCSKHPRVCVHTSIVTTHPDIAKQWHPTKNGDLTPDKISFGMTKKAWWLCSNTCSNGCKHEWNAFINNRCKQLHNCPFCSNYKVCVHTSIVNTHPNIIKQWHPTKNGDLKPEQFSFGSDILVWWLCPNTCSKGCLHEWKANINKRLIKSENAGCPYCASNHKQVCIHDSIVTTHPEIAKQWHPTKNGDLTPDKIIAGCCAKIWWRCTNTCEFGCIHEWTARPTDRTRKNTGCPQCAKFKHKICFHQSIAYLHPLIVKEWHPTKNGNLKPEMFSSGSVKRIWWKCANNQFHEWTTSINNRCSGMMSECPQCLNKTEERVFNVLAKHYPDIVRQFTFHTCKRIKFLKFDVCIPSHKVIIEIDGAQHFKYIKRWNNDPEKTLQRDIFKIRKAEEAGYKVIHICQESVYLNNDEWIETHLICEIETNDSCHMFIALNANLYTRHIQLLESNKIITINDI